MHIHSTYAALPRPTRHPSPGVLKHAERFFRKQFFRFLPSKVPPLEETFAALMQSLDSKITMRLRSNYMKLVRKLLRLCTLFTGTEMYFVVLRDLLTYLGKVFGAEVEVSLEWTVEKDPWKRDFVHERTPSKISLADAIQLAREKWRGTDCYTNVVVNLEATDVFAAGFECDTVSKLTNDSKAVVCMELQQGKTGTTGRVTLLCIVRFRFKLSILENSSILGARNIQYITHYLNVYGFFVHDTMKKAELYGSGVKRERQYLLVVPVCEGEIDQLKDDFPTPAWVAEFENIMTMLQIGSSSPDKVLLDKDDPVYVSFLDEAENDRLLLDEKEMRRQQKALLTGRPDPTKVAEEWEADHLELFRREGLAWPPNIEASDPELFAAVRHLQRRKREAAYWHTYRPRSADTADLRTFHDLQPTLKFESQVVNEVNTVVCTATIFDRLRKKILSGYELLLLQGYPKALLNAAPLPSNLQMTELGGNSFNAHVLAAINMAALAVGLFNDHEEDRPRIWANADRATWSSSEFGEEEEGEEETLTETEPELEEEA